MKQKISIALTGNPNCGKTTLFNALTGSSQYVGNWPGVTVEKKEGHLQQNKDIVITDLPGIYSLSPYTPEEVIARNYLLEEHPNAILNIIDGTNLERSLYLTTQLLELGIPVVVAVNMMDIVKKSGETIHSKELGKKLGCPVIEISALKNSGINEAIDAVMSATTAEYSALPQKFSAPLETILTELQQAIPKEIPENQRRWYALKLFERDQKVLDQLHLEAESLRQVEELITQMENRMDDDAESIVTNERYLSVTKLLNGVYRKKNPGQLSPSDKIDKIITNRVLALPIFAIVMFVVYYISVTTVGTWVTDWTNDGLFGDGFSILGLSIPGIPVLAENGLSAIGCAPWLQGLIIDGIIGGVGAVLGFVPQMMILFLFLAILESCGYMARVAFVMDRIFRKFGLSGKSFIPMLIGTGCGVPGILASRTIENQRDRRMTIITTTFIPCGAKMPIVAMLAAAVFHNDWWVAPSAYFLGVSAVIISGIILKKTRPFAGEPAPFVMELPAYHRPPVKNVLLSMWERSWAFMKRAGTIILISAIVIWAASHFGIVNGAVAFQSEMELENSFLGIFGAAVCWIFSPLGFGEIKATVATIMGLVAKEEVVAVLGVLDFEGMTPLAAYAFLTFNLLCAPCFAAIGAIRREMNSAAWTAFAIAYQCGFAYAIALIIYQGGLLFTGQTNLPGLCFAAVTLLLLIYLLFRSNRKAAMISKN